MTSAEAKAKKESEILISGLTQKQWYSDVYLNSSHWKELRAQALTHYGRKCNRCPATSHLQVHHNQYRNIYDVGIDDLEILCGKCHQNHHDKPRTKKQRQKKANRKLFKAERKAKKEAKRLAREQKKKDRPEIPQDIEKEIVGWMEHFKDRPIPEAAAIRHIMHERGFQLSKQLKLQLRKRRRKLERTEIEKPTRNPHQAKSGSDFPRSQELDRAIQKSDWKRVREIEEKMKWAELANALHWPKATE